MVAVLLSPICAMKALVRSGTGRISSIGSESVPAAQAPAEAPAHGSLGAVCACTVCAPSTIIAAMASLAECVRMATLLYCPWGGPARCGAAPQVIGCQFGALGAPWVTMALMPVPFWVMVEKLSLEFCVTSAK